MMRIGIVYDRVEDYAHIGGPADRFAEFEPDSTIRAMKEAVKLAGHHPVDVGSPENLLSPPQIDLAWNIAEGYGTRNREAWAPVLLEMHGIPCLGSDAFTLSTSLDKHLTRIIASHLEIPIAPGLVLSSADHIAQQNLPDTPWLIKPRYEGTAKGIDPNAIVYHPEELSGIVSKLIDQYEQDVLVEMFLPGAEYTCAVYGAPLRPSPVMQRSLDRRTKLGVHALASNEEIPESDQILPGSLDVELEQQIITWSMDLCREMNIRHFARVDFKIDHSGRPAFLEINPLPTFAVDSTFAILAEMEGTPYTEFLATILSEIINDVSVKPQTTQQANQY